MKYRGWTHPAALLLVGAAQLSLAAGLDHEPLQPVEGLDFATLLEAAVQNAPQALETPVRAQQAADYVAAGSSLINGRASIVYNMLDDRWRDNRVGFRQIDMGVALPLWRLGERSDAKAMGKHYEEQVALWGDYLRWQLAGRLRAALNELAAAEAQLELEREAARAAEAVHDATERLFAAGSLARLDTLQTRTLLLEQQQRVLDAEARLVDAERTFQVLTGLNQRPAAPHAETLSSLEDIPETHPVLSYLRSEVTLAADKVRQSEIEAKGSPEITVGTHTDRADYASPTFDSVWISLSVPIGGKSVVQSRSSGARREHVDAEVALREGFIELQRLLHEAEHSLFVTSQTLPLVEERATLAEERRQMAERAFEAGELTLAQALNALQDAIAARQTLSDLRLEQQRLTSEYNQLIGVLP